MPAQNIVFFDGVCNLCNYWVNFLIKRKPPYKLASLQGETAKVYLPEEKLKKLDSVIYLKNDKMFFRSRAILQLLIDIGGPWKVLTLLKVIPPFLADPIYSLIASSRYKIFGQKEICRVPTEKDKEYLLP